VFYFFLKKKNNNNNKDSSTHCRSTGLEKVKHKYKNQQLDGRGRGRVFALGFSIQQNKAESGV
jgi:hypothetical protein